MHLELITFKTVAGTDLDAVVEASDGVNQFCQAQSGFVYRTLSQDASTGLWFDAVYWDNAACAEKADAAFEGDANCQKLLALIDQGSVSIQHSDVKSFCGASE